MANIDIISRMNRLLDAYEHGELRPEEVETAIEFHMEALEGLPYHRIKEAHVLSSRLVTAHCFVGEEEFIAFEEVSAVLRDFREFLKILPGASP